MSGLCVQYIWRLCSSSWLHLPMKRNVVGIIRAGQFKKFLVNVREHVAAIDD